MTRQHATTRRQSQYPDTVPPRQYARVQTVTEKKITNYIMTNEQHTDDHRVPGMRVARAGRQRDQSQAKAIQCRSSEYNDTPNLVTEREG